MTASRISQRPLAQQFALLLSATALLHVGALVVAAHAMWGQQALGRAQLVLSLLLLALALGMSTWFVVARVLAPIRRLQALTQTLSNASIGRDFAVPVADPDTAASRNEVQQLALSVVELSNSIQVLARKLRSARPQDTGVAPEAAAPGGRLDGSLDTRLGAGPGASPPPHPAAFGGPVG